MLVVSKARTRSVSPRGWRSRGVCRYEHSRGESEGLGGGLLASLAHLLPDVARWRGVLPHYLTHESSDLTAYATNTLQPMNQGKVTKPMGNLLAVDTQKVSWQETIPPAVSVGSHNGPA